MKHRFLIHLALLLLVAMLLPAPVMAESLIATPADEVYSLEQATPPEELPEFQLVAPETKEIHDADATVMAVSEDTDIPKASTSTKLTLGVKEKYTLKISGAKAYETSDKTVATVSKKGVIVGKKAGKATITATDKKGKQTKVKVTVKKAPANVTLNKTKYTLTVGKTLQLKAKLPSDTASNKITWTSSKKSVATVDANGKVTAVKAGKAKITVKTFNGKKATCTVTVKNPAPKKVALNEKKATLTVGETLELAAKLQPDNAISKLTWTSSNKNVAKVSTKGKVTAIKAGKAVITVKTANGKRAKCTITVKAVVKPTPEPTKEPTPEPTEEPTPVPTEEPAPVPTEEPTPVPTEEPTPVPTEEPTPVPTEEPTPVPTEEPMPVPTVEPTPVPTVEPTPEPTPVPLSVDRTSINVEAGKRGTVTVTYLSDNTLAWNVDNTGIATCRWGNDWVGDSCNLTIIGLSEGTTTVTIYDEDTLDAIDVLVTVSGEIEQETDLIGIIAKDIPVANIISNRQFTHYQDNAYSDGGNIMVTINDSGWIETVGFFNDIGAYKLCGLWPGQSITSALKVLNGMNWQLVSDRDQVGRFTNELLPGFILSFKYANSRVEYIILSC